MDMSLPELSRCLPYFAQGTVVKGFGRGSSELGIPTANFPEDVIHRLPEPFACGVYYGWACVNTLSPVRAHKMVMCVGWNPHYQNTVKTMETHIIHKFDSSFYGENLSIVILGYIRPMRAFDSLDALISAMNDDIRFAENALDQPGNREFCHHPSLTSSVGSTGTRLSEHDSHAVTCNNGFIDKACPAYDHKTSKSSSSYGCEQGGTCDSDKAPASFSSGNSNSNTPSEVSGRSVDSLHSSSPSVAYVDSPIRPNRVSCVVTERYNAKENENQGFPSSRRVDEDKQKPQIKNALNSSSCVDCTRATASKINLCRL